MSRCFDGFPRYREGSRWWDKISAMRRAPFRKEPRYAMVERDETGAVVTLVNFVRGNVSLDRLARQKGFVQRDGLPIIGDVSAMSDEQLVSVAISDRPSEAVVLSPPTK